MPRAQHQLPFLKQPVFVSFGNVRSRIKSSWKTEWSLFSPFRYDCNFNVFAAGATCLLTILPITLSFQHRDSRILQEVDLWDPGR